MQLYLSTANASVPLPPRPELKGIVQVSSLKPGATLSACSELLPFGSSYSEILWRALERAIPESLTHPIHCGCLPAGEARQVVLNLGFEELSVLTDGDFARVVKAGGRAVAIGGAQPHHDDCDRGGLVLRFSTVPG